MTTLVTADDYRRITGDSDSDEAAIDATLDEMLGLIQEELDRVLEYGTYTESLPLSHKGRVYPRAVPVASLPASASSSIEDEGWSLKGITTSPLTDSPLDLDDLEIRNISGTPSRYASVTYSGGYQYSDFPIKLRRLICRLAKAALSQAGGASSMLPGTTSASVGDVSVSLEAGTVGAGELDALIPGTCEALERFKRPVY